MSEKETPKRRPLKNSRPEGFQPKVWLIWAAIIVVMGVLGLLVVRMTKEM